MRHRNASIILLVLLLAGTALAGVVPGDKAPDFTLTDTAGETHTLSAYLAEGKTVVLEWFNPDCPFIKKHHQDHRTMDETAAAYKDQGVVWLAINSGAEGKQGAGLERNKKAFKDFKMSFPVLLDPDGTVGRAYGAKKTPHMFIVTREGAVAYMGAIDDDAGVQAPGKTNHVVAALDEILGGKPVTVSETESYGCSVKYAD
ncbi:thioredoxin family protein [bacterium]|nr:thioredoxin family protein [bacterium]